MTNVAEFRKQALEVHNRLRAKHGVPLMTLNEQLCGFAQEWADHLAKTGSMAHRTERKLGDKMTGENIYAGSKKNPAASDVVEYWYSEIKDHDYKNPNYMKSGHFSQVVWKGSTELGIGIAEGAKMTFVVGNYIPVGNMMGQFEANVLPPK